MTYVEENLKKLEELKKLQYKELSRMRKEVKSNPNAKRADLINICVACAEVEIEQNIGRTYTIDEVRKKLGIEERNIKARCTRWHCSN